MVPRYGWGSTASRLEPLRGSSLLFTTKPKAEGMMEQKMAEGVKDVHWCKETAFYFV